MCADCDELLRISIAFFPNPDSGETRDVIGRVYAALVLRQRNERRVPCLRAQPRLIRERYAGVVAELRTEEPIRPVFVQNAEVVPYPTKVHLREPRTGEGHK